MAAFQISITPPAKKLNVENRTAEIPENVPPRLVLAPFKPTPEVIFGTVYVHNKSTRSLIVLNPGPSPMMMQLKNVDAEDRITMDESVFQLKSREEKEVFISWDPIQIGYLRKIIHVQDATKKARSFDVLLTGTCVTNKAAQLAKRNRLREGNQNTKPNETTNKTKSLNSTVTLCPIPDLRRQTYLVEEKENRQPNSDNQIFRTSSPKWQTTFNTSVNDYFHSTHHSDNLDIPVKYTKFESELQSKRNSSSFHCSGEVAPNRDTTTINSEDNGLFNPFSVSSVDEVDSSLKNLSDFNLLTNSKGDITFDKSNVFLTPMKPIDHLASPEPPNLFGSNELLNRESLYGCERKTPESNYSCERKTNDCLFISPPSKSIANIKKSPDYLMPRRSVSSAISDRKRHLKTNILPRRKTPPNFNKVVKSVEKFKQHDPQSLKRALKSHMDDPFLKQSLYCDENWIDRQEKNVIKWMNSLLTPPMEFKDENEISSVDAADIWLKGRQNGELRAVPSVDNVAFAIYNSPQKMNTLRKVALSTANNDPVSSVFKNLAISIDKKIISVREDRDLHVDHGLRNKLLQLLACYNPLWLQIGLETIYKQQITKQPKSDIGGLGGFIRKHLLSSTVANKKNAHPAVLQIKRPSYKDQAKKYILEKFLCLIYFLDQAKLRKIIRHNPCLFVAKSKFKSSQEILLEFCGDLVVGRGDITKHLKAINYVLTYKQTCIDEYDYTITSLHDLRDGVRLARLFEILFAEPDICTRLRVPAISLLQKNFNVNEAMNVAQKNCNIEGGITAKEITAGNREKILSFLWQIINNYLSPRYEKSATKIQKWWRKKLIIVRVKQLIRAQNEQLSVTLKQTELAAVKLQRWFRAGRTSQIAKQQREYFLELKRNCILIQRKFRARCEMKFERDRYLELRKTVCTVQNKFRANRAMKAERKLFMEKKRAAVLIQSTYRAVRVARDQRKKYLELKSAVVCVQRRFRETRAATLERKRFIDLKNATIKIQQRFRANQAMIVERNRYIKLRSATLSIQRTFRATRMMRQQKAQFLEARNAAILIQRKFKANLAMKTERKQYLELKAATVIIQRRFRAILSMRSKRTWYTNMKKAAITIQRKFRAYRLSKVEKNNYLLLKRKTMLIQRIYRANRKMKLEKQRYENLKTAVITVQRRFRAKLVAKEERQRFLTLKQSAILIQRKFRANVMARIERKNYVDFKNKVIYIQRMFRAKRAAAAQQKQFLQLRSAVIFTQRKYKANRAIKIVRKEMVELKKAVILIQRKFRANCAMKAQRSNFMRLRNNVIFVQRTFRAKLKAREERKKFLQLKTSCIFIQRKYREILIRRLEEAIFFNNTPAVLYSEEDLAAIKIQALWRGYIQRKKKPLKKRKSSLLENKKRSVPENPDVKFTLGERYKKAILILKTSDMYNVVTGALWNLESVTMLSAKLCEGVVSEGIIPIVFNLMARGNRSVPAIEIYRSGFSVFVNLARYRPTRLVLWDSMDKANDLSFIFYMLKIFHEKLENPVFRYVSTLLWLLCQEEAINRAISQEPLIRQQIERMLDTLKKKCSKNAQFKRDLKTLPKTESDWFPNPNNRIFANNYVAIVNIHYILYNS